MSFRDDREAAHRRADALEQELESARQELAALKGARPPRRRVALVTASLALGAALVGAAGFVVVAKRARTSMRAREAQALAVAAQARAMDEARRAEDLSRQALEQAELSRARLAEDQRIAEQAAQDARAAALAAAAPTTVTWRGTLDAATGIDLPPGAPCEVTGTYSGAGGALRARALTLRCAGRELYRAGPEALAAAPGLREGTLPASGKHLYLLSFRDESPSPAPRTRASISSLRHEASVWRDGPTPMGARVFLRDVSDPREGEAMGVGRRTRAPGFDEVIDRVARVTRATGRAGVARGDRCVFQLRPVWEYPESCRIALRCGTAWLYGVGEAGYLTCELRDGRPVSALDENTTPNGGDPRVVWRGRQIAVSDFSEAGAWEVDLAL